MISSCYKCDLCNGLIDVGIEITGTVKVILGGHAPTDMFPVPCQHVCEDCLSDYLVGDAEEEPPEDDED